MTILDLKDCFKEDFINWLVKSNHPFVSKKMSNEKSPIYPEKSPIYPETLNNAVTQSLNEILQVLLIEPQADYFWYGYPDHGSKLSYSLPHHDMVPGDALRVDEEKIKAFLRNWKLEKLGIC